MTWPAIQGKIKVIVEAVAETGNVYDKLRQTRFWDDFINRNIAAGRVNIWEITRVQRRRELIGVSNLNVWHVRHMVVIRGQLGVNDKKDSEIDFQKMIDDIDTGFKNDPLLGPTPGTESLILPLEPSEPIIGHRMVNSVLVHFGVFQFEAIERVS